MNDIFPFDFFAQAEGHGTITGYLFDRHQVGTYVNGRQLGELRFDSRIAVLRLSRFYTLGGWKVAPTLVLSGADSTLSGASVPPGAVTHAGGFGDVRIGGTIWFIDQPAERNFLALNLTTMWPTGQYDKNQLVNLGENRRRAALSLGWVRGIGDDVTLELTPELAWYGSNPGFFPGNLRLDQDRTLSLTGYLTYRFTPSLRGFVGGQFNEGGETAFNGIAQNNPIHGRRAYIGGSYLVNKSNAINFRLAEDRSLSSGLRTTRDVALRWVVLY